VRELAAGEELGVAGNVGRSDEPGLFAETHAERYRKRCCRAVSARPPCPSTGPRLERRGWIDAEWGESDNNRKAKYYELTRAGRAQLAAETAAWAKLTRAVELVLDMG
jgi:hypothetical protein